MTFEEKRGAIKGRTVAWTGDSNNVQASWVHAAGILGFTLRVATPKELAPRETLREWAQHHAAKVVFTDDPEAAVANADCVVTTPGSSMGDEDTTRQRHNLLKPYQVNEKLMARAAKDALFMHCLPRPTATRKSPTRSWTARTRSSSTKPKTGCMRRRRF